MSLLRNLVIFLTLFSIILSASPVVEWKDILPGEVVRLSGKIKSSGKFEMLVQRSNSADIPYRIISFEAHGEGVLGPWKSDNAKIVSFMSTKARMAILYTKFLSTFVPLPTSFSISEIELNEIGWLGLH